MGEKPKIEEAIVEGPKSAFELDAFEIGLLPDRDQLQIAGVYIDEVLRGDPEISDFDLTERLIATGVFNGVLVQTAVLVRRLTIEASA